MVEDSALDENAALTLSMPTVTTSMDVIFFLGSIVVELVVLPTPWLGSPGENLRYGFVRSGDGDVLDITSSLEAPSWRP